MTRVYNVLCDLPIFVSWVPLRNIARMPNLQNNSSPSTPGILGPGADKALAPLTAPEMRQRVLVAHLTERFRQATQEKLGLPLGRVLLNLWLRNIPGEQKIEEWGLPRHVIEEQLGVEALTLHVDPRQLIRIAVHARRSVEKRPSSLAFIWEGSWDLRREDLRVGTRYRFISEIDENRDSLQDTERYKKLLRYIERGRPWASHQQGVLLDTPEKIADYLRVYLHYLDDMALNGYDASRGKDPIGVVISREGRILKANRGLHRLAMAQRLGLPSIPVQVRHIHREWWDKIRQGTTGHEALERLRLALLTCTPETNPGPLDEDPEIEFPADFWPESRRS